MTVLEKRFLLDARFNGHEKLFCLIVWSNNFTTKDQHIVTATCMTEFEINAARQLLITKNIVTKRNSQYSLKSIKEIYG